MKTQNTKHIVGKAAERVGNVFRKIPLFVIAGLFFCVISSLTTSQAYAQTVTFVPDSPSVNANAAFNVKVNISGATNVFGAAFDVLYDPSLFLFTGATEGSFLTGCSKTFLTNESPQGDVVVGLTRLGATCKGVSGSGDLATLNFKARSNPGTGQLSFSRNSLCVVDASSTSCNTSASNGQWSPTSLTVVATVQPAQPGTVLFSSTGTPPENEGQSLPATGGTVTINGNVVNVTPTPQPASGSGDTGGGGGGSYFPYVDPSLFQNPSATPVPELIVFERNLVPGMKNAEVEKLQAFLFDNGYLKTDDLKAESGSYGARTKKAVDTFQHDKKIAALGSPFTIEYGVFDQNTRKAVNDILIAKPLDKKSLALVASSSLALSTTTVTSIINSAVSTSTELQGQKYTFSRILTLGSIGDDVRALQQFLNTHNFTVSPQGNGSPGNESTYFGPATANALAAFQTQYADTILKPFGLTQGTGVLGTYTMKFINSFTNGGMSTSSLPQSGITVISPNGGEGYTVYKNSGIPFQFIWKADYTPYDPMAYLYSSRYGAVAWKKVSYNSQSDYQVASFDPSLIYAGDYLLVICDSARRPGDDLICDASNDYFSIVTR